MKLLRFLLVCFPIVVLISCSTPPPVERKPCEENEPKVKTTGTMKMGVNNHGDAIGEYSIGIGVSTILGQSGNSKC